jgi:DNA-binding GntR family transcriptional regulator
LHASELREVFALRLDMEPAAVAAGAARAQPEDHAATGELLARLNGALAARDFAASGQLNREFHVQLVVPRLQPVTADILTRLHTLAQRHVQAHLRPEGRAGRAAREHQALFRAWQAARGGAVRRLMRQHIAATLRDLLRVV